MVNWIIVLGILFAGEVSAAWGSSRPAQYVDVSATIDPYQSIENQPIQGTATITHSNQDPVDQNSFTLDNKPLKVEFVKEVQIDPQKPLVISIYNFTMPAQPKGLYMLPSISVQVGKKRYQSIPTSYEVFGHEKWQQVKKAKVQPQEQVKTIKQDAAPHLTVEGIVEGPKKIYPGQHLLFKYRYEFTGNIDLAKEELPLFEAKGFKLVGEKQGTSSEEAGHSINTITQEVIADKPGDYQFPKGHVEGYAYIIEGGRKHYQEPKLIVETAEIDIKVLPFPEKGRPANFNGAIGDFAFNARLQGPSTVGIDQKLELILTMKGEGQFSTITLPDLSKLKSFFRISDLPPKEKTKETQKSFLIEMYPITQVKEIPSISFSYFNPNSGNYVTRHSDPIPLTVKQQVEESPPEAQLKQPKIELGNQWNLLWLISLAAIGAFVLWNLKPKKQLNKEVQKEESKTLFKNALEADEDHFFPLLTRALLTRLHELKSIPANNIEPSELPDAGISGKVKQFLATIEAERYGGSQQHTLEQWKEQATTLFNRLQ